MVQAGEFAATLDGAAVRWIRWMGVEVLRGLEITVRDSAWGTVSPDIRDLTINAARRTCAIRYRAHYGTDEIDLDAVVAIELSSTGRLRVDLTATANSTFRRNRIGIIALHPMEVAGHDATFHTTSGTLASSFPLGIEPGVVTTDLRSMSWDVREGVRGDLALEGDVWEMEDQRNWTDASFKTYPTPLRLPFPATVTKGSIIRQSATLIMNGEPGAVIDALPPAITVLGSPRPFPSLGSELPPGDDEPSSALVGAVRRLGLDFLRATIGPENAESDAGRIARWADALGLAVEVEVRVRDGTALEPALRPLLPRLRGVYAFDDTMGLGHDSSPGVVDAVRRALGSLGSAAPVGGGTRANFTELNRSRPSADGIDGITYAVNPQVHAFDEESIVETLQVLPLTVTEVRRLVPARPISTVVSLRPRFNAVAQQTLTDATGWPVRADPRQRSRFAAVWFMGAISALSRAAVDSIVLAETHGPAGLIEHVLPAPKMTPLAAVISRIKSQQSISLLEVAGPAGLATLALGGDLTHILVAGDLSGKARDVEIGPSLRRVTPSILADGRWDRFSEQVSPAGNMRLPPWAIVVWRSPP